jgi:hypothetical protein
MIRFVAALVLAISVSAVFAQNATPDTEHGRFSFNAVPEGLLRLDTRTGQVSLCSKREVGWACQVVPDERAVLESEIARLQGENGLLKKEMIARGMPLPGPAKAEPPRVRPESARPERELNLPSDAELDRVIGFMEKVWRRLLDMVEEMQRDRDRRG